jgi:hypothetical protein
MLPDQDVAKVLARWSALFDFLVSESAACKHVVAQRGCCRR